MSEWLKKETSIFERDEEGKLIAVNVELETLPDKDKPKVKLIPMTRGKLQRIYADNKDGTTDPDLDNQMIIEHCVNPKYTEEEVKLIKPQISGAIVTAILSVSLGVSQEDVNKKTTEEAIRINEEYLKKK